MLLWAQQAGEQCSSTQQPVRGRRCRRCTDTHPHTYTHKHTPTHTRKISVSHTHPQLQRQRIPMHACIACSRTSSRTTTLCSRSQEHTASLPHILMQLSHLRQQVPGSKCCCVTAHAVHTGLQISQGAASRVQHTKHDWPRCVPRKPAAVQHRLGWPTAGSSISPIKGQHAQQAHCAGGWAQRAAATCHPSPDKPGLGSKPFTAAAGT